METYDKDTKAIIERDVLFSCGTNIRNILTKVKEQDFHTVEEIRIRIDKPLMFNTSSGDYFLSTDGTLTKNINHAYLIKLIDITQTVELMSENSLYAYQEELKNGFITLKGGHRVGLVGKIVIDKNEIKTVKDISGLNIRIARQVNGCANKIISKIIDKKTIHHTLIISPPNCGKTTMLRDIIRQISDGVENLCGLKVGVVDERSEIAACYKGIPQNNVGVRTDVLDTCPKPQGIAILVRSMSPNVIATDELGTKEDVKAVEEALNAGIRLITTAHAKDLEELSKKTGISELFKQKLFGRIVVLSNARGPGTIEDIIDGDTLTYIWRDENVS